MNEKHIPVLLQEVITLLDPQPDADFIDATLGYGGHASEILKHTSPNGELIGIDQDDSALEYAQKYLEGFGERFSTYYGNFTEIDNAAVRRPVSGGILADIGVSSVQLDETERGFSFREGPLDMRMDRENELTAKIIINDWPEARIQKIIRDYGEERFAKQIANRIVEARAEKSIETTRELVEIVERAIPRRLWPEHISPATRTFQAVRIAVNDELGALETFLPKAVDLLQPRARLGIISFHSLEDRIVKDFFRERANPCTCPPEFPKCVCNKVADIKIITRKPVTATKNEIEGNPRSRSAKLRVVEKI